MKTNISVKKLLMFTRALFILIYSSGCNKSNPQQSVNSSIHTVESQVVNESVDGVYDEPIEQPVQPAAPQAPEQEMCWGCGDLPVSGSDIYCVNCKCMLCNQRRKLGGNYMYCSKHNCDDSGCAAMAVENSQYCVSHKCAMPNCNSKVWTGSQYCGIHK